MTNYTFLRPAALDPILDTQIAIVGDSIAAGSTAGLTTDLETELAAYSPFLNEATFTNDGVAGSRLDKSVTGGTLSDPDMAHRYTAQVYPLRPAGSGSKRSILCIIIGANDFPVIDATSEITAWTSAFEDYVSTARADGFRVIAATIMRRASFTDDKPQENFNRLQINDFIRRCQYLDGVVDLAELMDVNDNPEWFIDDTHPNDVGIALMARLFHKAIMQLGWDVKPQTTYPAADLVPVRSAAEVELLEKAAIERTASGSTSPSFKTAVADIGTGDFTVSFWHFHSVDNATNTVVFSTDNSIDFGVLKASEYPFGAYPYITGALALSRQTNMMPESWHHIAFVRDGTDLTAYVNGVAQYYYSDMDVTQSTIQTLSTDVGVIDEFLDVGVQKNARARFYDRALSAAEVLAEYERLSRFDADEANYIFAADDGANCAGFQIKDLSGNGCDVILTSNATIPYPGKVGIRTFSTSGNGTISASLPSGAIIRMWLMEVTTAGGGNVNIGTTNNGGEIIPDTAFATGDHLLDIGAPIYPGGTIYINASGYVINHTITFDVV